MTLLFKNGAYAIYTLRTDRCNARHNATQTSSKHMPLRQLRFTTPVVASNVRELQDSVQAQSIAQQQLPGVRPCNTADRSNGRLCNLGDRWSARTRQGRLTGCPLNSLEEGLLRWTTHTRLSPQLWQATACRRPPYISAFLYLLRILAVPCSSTAHTGHMHDML